MESDRAQNGGEITATKLSLRFRLSDAYKALSDYMQYNKILLQALNDIG